MESFESEGNANTPDSALSRLVTVSVETPDGVDQVKKDATADFDDGKSFSLDEKMIESNLYRLTAGLPKRELRLVIEEATECEALLLAEIQTLEEALKNERKSTKYVGNTDDSLKKLLGSQLSPLDQFLTVSALLGRLRHDLALPSLGVNSSNATRTAYSGIDEENSIEKLTNVSSPIAETYTMILPSDTLLSAWRKISTNRAAFVFKRPVKSEEAPGYSDRIRFPMDLSLIRKRIVTNNIQTFADLHMALGLISHNCVKYNGRETDYGRVAREFEALVDSVILQAVKLVATNPLLEASSGTSEMIVKVVRDEDVSEEPANTEVNCRTNVDGKTQTHFTEERVAAIDATTTFNSASKDLALS